MAMIYDNQQLVEALDCPPGMVEGLAQQSSSTNTVFSQDRRFKLIVQDDGNLVLYRHYGDNDDGAQPIWSSNTANYNVKDTLKGGETLHAGGYLFSKHDNGDGQFFLRMQDDGNLVVYKRTALQGEKNIPLWSTKTNDRGVALQMKADGNLCVLDRSGNGAWESKTGGNDGAYAMMQGDGNLVVYAHDKKTPLWHSNTYKN